MRTRDEVIKSVNNARSTVYDRYVIIELLLDIRDLLTTRN